MTEAEWLVMVDSQPMLAFLRARASARKIRLFGVASCRELWDWSGESISQESVSLVEVFADGGVSGQELASAHQIATARATVCDEGRSAAFMATMRLPATAQPEQTYRDACLKALAARAIAGLCAPDAHRAAASAAGGVADAFGLQLRARLATWAEHATLLRDIFGNPFRPVAFDAAWRTSTAVALAAQMYESREFSAMPILADALQDAGCDYPDILNHCRGDEAHVRGCWVVDLVLGKE